MSESTTHDPLCPVGVKPWEDNYCCQRCNPGETPPWERTCRPRPTVRHGWEDRPMTHDPMCPLFQPCIDVPRHGFCSWQQTHCIHCYRDCHCALITSPPPAASSKR